jgi:hypothetical protein
VDDAVVGCSCLHPGFPEQLFTDTVVGRKGTQSMQNSEDNDVSRLMTETTSRTPMIVVHDHVASEFLASSPCAQLAVHLTLRVLIPQLVPVAHSWKDAS